MAWSKLKQQLESFLCHALYGRVEYRAYSYRYLPINDEEIEAVRKDMKGIVPEDRLRVIASSRKKTEYKKLKARGLSVSFLGHN